MTSRGNVCPSILVTFGVILFLSSFALDLFVKSKINEELGQRLVLLNHSQFYQGWENPPIPIYSKFYIFNITNYNRIFGGVKPVLQQVGPFVFRKTISRQILGYNDDHEELSFITSNSYHFVPEKSDMKAFDSKIYTVNIPMAVMIGKMMDTIKVNPFAKFIIGPLVQKIRELNEKLIIPTTPRAYLIDSYDIKILQEMAKMAPPEQRFNAPNKFSIMMNRNESTRGVWTVFTGKSNPSMTGIIKSWNNQTELKCWKGEPCDQIRGAEGAFFAPPITPEKKLYIFSPELNISIIGTYSHPVYENKLLKYRFNVLETQFNNQENSCYCARDTQEDRDAYCPLDGLIDLNHCSGGLPLLMSKPHFYNSDQRLLDMVHGLQPNKSAHESFMDLDPWLGVVTRATVRMQMNIDFAPIKSIPLYRGIKPYIMPCNWAEEGIRLSDDDEHLLAPLQEMQGALKKVNFTIKVIMVLGVALICSSIVFWIKARRLKEKLHFADIKCSVNGEVKEAEDELRAFISASKGEANIEMNKYCSSDVNSGEKESHETTEKAPLPTSDEDEVFHSNDDDVNDLNTHTSNNNN